MLSIPKIYVPAVENAVTTSPFVWTTHPLGFFMNPRNVYILTIYQIHRAGNKAVRVLKLQLTSVLLLHRLTICQYISLTTRYPINRCVEWLVQFYRYILDAGISQTVRCSAINLKSLSKEELHRYATFLHKCSTQSAEIQPLATRS